MNNTIVRNSLLAAVVLLTVALIGLGLHHHSEVSSLESKMATLENTLDWEQKESERWYAMYIEEVKNSKYGLPITPEELEEK